MRAHRTLLAEFSIVALITAVVGVALAGSPSFTGSAEAAFPGDNGPIVFSDRPQIEESTSARPASARIEIAIDPTSVPDSR